MYAIIQNGTYLALTEKPRYVKLNNNEVWVTCEKKDALGISVNGTLYNLLGRADIEGAKEVVIKEVENGEFLFSSLKQIQNIDNTMNITFVTMAEAGSLDDTTIVEHATAFADWVYPVTYKEGSIRRYDGKLYRCLQSHDSQDTWTPTAATSLWVAIADPNEEWPTWAQPIGATDAYMEGDQVYYNEKYYVSYLDNNVWEPDVYGWDEVSGETSSEK